MYNVQSTIYPVQSSVGIAGSGEGIEYEGNEYYYRVGKRIPKDKAVALRHESNYFGRQHGEVIHIIVAWNGKNFIVLENIVDGIRETKQKYKGLSTEQAIKFAKEQEKKLKAKWDAMPKCKQCKKPVVVLMKDQPFNICLSCFKETKL